MWEMLGESGACEAEYPGKQATIQEWDSFAFSVYGSCACLRLDSAFRAAAYL